MLKDVRKDPYALPDGFEWSTVDITDEAQRQQIYKFLSKNYVQDTDGTFRFNYSEEFLLWALTPPGRADDWCVSIRTTKGKKPIVGFISAIKVHMNVII